MKQVAKSIIMLFLVAVLLFQVMPMVGAADLEEEQLNDRAVRYVVTRGTYVMSSDDGTGYSLGYVTAGTKLTHVSGTWSHGNNSTWVGVSYGSGTGYVRCSYLCKVGYCYTISTASAPVYNGLGSGGIKFNLSYGTYVYTEEDVSANTWVFINVDSGTYLNEYGYVNSSKLTKVS